MDENNEDVPYRAPVTQSTPDKATDNDDEDFSTIVEAKKILDKAIVDLSKDFNAFDLTKTSKSPVDLWRQVAARQIAYDLLVPIQSLLHSAMQAVIDKRKE